MTLNYMKKSRNRKLGVHLNLGTGTKVEQNLCKCLLVFIQEHQVEFVNIYIWFLWAIV